MSNCGRLRISQGVVNQLLIDKFRGARSEEALAVLEGFHPLKHAVRFGAKVGEVVTHDREQLQGLTESLSPDLAGILGKDIVEVPDRVFRQLSPVPPATGVMALAQRPKFDPHSFDRNNPAPLVLLENPRSHGNIGAVVRVAAAVGASGVITTGEHDPWHPSALVGSAGLHFALPVGRERCLSTGSRIKRPAWLAGRHLLAVDPEGELLERDSIPEGAVLAFGTEREGLSRELRAAADGCISIPMQPGVSSLNLATAVAVVLYLWRLG